MLNIRGIYQKNKGFTLIEVILALAISSMIILPIFSILNFSVNACITGEEKDELMLNGRYAIEYIKNEVRAAEKIITSNKIVGLRANYPTNIGFVIMMPEGNLYNRFITYHTKNGELIRLSGKVPKSRYPTYNELAGFNQICEFVDSIKDSKFHADHNMIYLDFKFKSNSRENLRLKTDIFIRCPIDY